MKINIKLTKKQRLVREKVIAYILVSICSIFFIVPLLWMLLTALKTPEDLANGPVNAMSYMGKVSALVYARYEAGQKPIAMVSMDNCSHNGDKLYAAVNAFAEAWVKNGVVDAGFLAYVNDKSKVTFPWTMIDKISII